MHSVLINNFCYLLLRIHVFIDTHCHLTAPEYTHDLVDVLERAKKANVEHAICIGDDMLSSLQAIDLCQRYPQLSATVGIHPHKAGEFTQDSIVKLTHLAQHSHVVAIGEIGLDYHYNFCDPNLQKVALQEQILLANTLDLPIVLHNRDSWNDLWSIVQDLQPKKAVLHCCTEPWEHVEQWLSAGYYVSFTGIATFAAAATVRQVITNTPLDCMMIETDGPYLAPVPHRGKRNESAFLAYTAQAIATLKHRTLEEVALQTTKTAQEFFCLKI